MARLVLPAGTYKVEIILDRAAGGAQESSVFEGVEIRPGRAVFVNFRAN